MLRAELSKQPSVPAPVESQFACFQFAYSIVEALVELPQDIPACTYPFLHHLVRAVKLCLEVMATELRLKDYYGSIIILAVVSLRRYSAKCWLSASMTQDILVICGLATQVFCTNDFQDLSAGSASGIFSESMVKQSMPLGSYPDGGAPEAPPSVKKDSFTPELLTIPMLPMPGDLLQIPLEGESSENQGLFEIPNDPASESTFEDPWDFTFL
jgi:hypothetical protein